MRRFRRKPATLEHAVLKAVGSVIPKTWYTLVETQAHEDGYRITVFTRPRKV